MMLDAAIIAIEDPDASGDRQSSLELVDAIFCSTRCARLYNDKQKTREYTNRYQLSIFDALDAAAGSSV